MKKKWIRGIKIALMAYGLTGIVFFYLQDALLFHPSPLAKNAAYSFNGLHARELAIPYDPETELHVVQFGTGSPAPAKGVVLYFHGNRKNIGWYAKYVSNFTKNGYEVWMLDYPGFGKSTGKLTEQRLYDYALQLYTLARVRYKPMEIVIYGKSLGTGIAAELASVRDCRFLILETPYYSMVSLVSHYFPIYPVNKMLHYHFPTNEYLEKVTAPVTIFHGTADGVVPYSNAIRLQPLLKPHDVFITIPGGSHNNLNDYPLFHEKLDALLAE